MSDRRSTRKSRQSPQASNSIRMTTAQVAVVAMPKSGALDDLNPINPKP